MSHHVDHRGAVPPWMDPDELPPLWHYLEVDDPTPTPPPPAAVEPPVVALADVEPLNLDDRTSTRPHGTPIDWAAIRAHARSVGFPVTTRPVDELAARRRHRLAVSPHHQRHHRRGA